MGAKTEGTKVVEETKVAEETQVMDAAETVEEVDPWKENVKFMAPLDGEKGDIFVSLNGHNYIIKRGEEVTIPKPIFEVLKNSTEMDQLAMRRQQELIAKGMALN